MSVVYKLKACLLKWILIVHSVKKTLRSLYRKENLFIAKTSQYWNRSASWQLTNVAHKLTFFLPAHAVAASISELSGWSKRHLDSMNAASVLAKE